jgi:hypothetical protein
MKYTTTVSTFAVLALLLVGCQTTELGTTWKSPEVTGPLSFKKVVVLVLNSTPAERRAQEDLLAGYIKRATAVPSYTIVPDEQLASRPFVKQKIVESGADGAVVLRLVESRNETTYVPGTTSYFDERTGAYAPYYRSPGQYVTDTIVRGEVSLYSVPEGKLLWSGSSTTSNPENARDFAMQVAKAAGEELRKQGLLK